MEANNGTNRWGRVTQPIAKHGNRPVVVVVVCGPRVLDSVWELSAVEHRGCTHSAAVPSYGSHPNTTQEAQHMLLEVNKKVQCMWECLVMSDV